MSMKFIPGALGALVVSGLLFGLFPAGPTAHAQEAVTIAPVDDRDVPQGSQIPEQRILEIEQKVKAYKEQMKAERAAQQREGAAQAESAEESEADQP